MAANRASAVTSVTKRRLDHALEVDEGEDEADTPAGVFEMQEDRAEMYGIAAAFAASAFALVESVQQSGRDRSEITKTWIVTSANPRASHAALDGETGAWADGKIYVKNANKTVNLRFWDPDAQTTSALLAY